MTSFLSDIPFDPLETWLLPKSEMLCMIRYQEDPPEDAREVGQTAKSTDEEKRQKEKKAAPGPGHPAAGDIHYSSIPTAKHLQAPNIRPRQPGHPTPSEPPNIRPPARKSGPSEPESNKPSAPVGHPASSARTSVPTPGRLASPVYAQ